jgi:hypothetical protein
MEAKTGFLVKAIEEAQATNRFLDTKAGTLIVFESSLLAIALYSLLDQSTLEWIQALARQVPIGYLVVLAACFICYVVGLVVHILLSLRIILPAENPEAYVAQDGFRPQRLFFLHRLDEEGRLRPSVVEYSMRLSGMDDDDIINEYIFELLKLSYIRKVKSDRLSFCFRLLAFLIVGIVVLGLLLALGLLMF